MKLFDTSTTKNLPTLSRSRSVVGRIPQEHLKELDSAHQNLSIKIEKRGRSWSQLYPEENSSRATSLSSDEQDLRTRKSDSQLTALGAVPLPELSIEKKDDDMAIVEGSSVAFEKADLHTKTEFGMQNPDSDQEQYSDQSTPESDDGPPLPPKDFSTPQDGTSEETDSYFNPFGLSRTNSIYSLSRVSFNNQLSQLTSLNLPQASSLSASISAIPTAPAAVKALIGAAEQMQRWIQKAKEVLGGLNAEDDIEWAAAGREGLDDVDTAVSKFESLVGVYVQAIEELQLREDIADTSAEGLELVVLHMEKTLKEWEEAKSLLRGVKEQVELAMEWEELWSVVLGDVGMELDNLSRVIFEMEEKRHKTITAEVESDHTTGVDINELETIVEESPSTAVGRPPANYRFSLPPSFAATTSANSPNPNTVQDDSNLLALFARMQPLRASLDFLPMRLSMFQSRAMAIFPTACEELETRRSGLEKSWKRLESDAEALRRELGEDRWVLVFRNAGRQAQKMCESVERSINKLQEAMDAGVQHSNPPALAKKVESFEAKKMHYGSAIERVLAIIQKGVNDRLTVNGEIIRLHSDMTTRWATLAERIRVMDLALEEENAARHQQLRDSISSIISMDKSAATSAIDTPGSSPASSVVMSGGKGDPSTPNGNSRRGSATANRPGTRSRYASMPPGSTGSSHLPRMNSTPRAVTTASHGLPSPSASSNGQTDTPRPSSRLQRPSATPVSNRPRWNSSPNTKDLLVGHNFKPLSQTTPSPYRKSPPNAIRTPRSASSYSGLPLPSPLSRETSSSPAPSVPSSTSTSTRRQSHIPSSSPLAPRIASPSPARAWAQQQAKLESSAATARPTATFSSRRSSIGPPPKGMSMPLPTPFSINEALESSSQKTASPDDYGSSPSIRPKSMAIPKPAPIPMYNGAAEWSQSQQENQRPGPTLTQSQPQPTSRSAKRMSMLPQPKGRGGRESAMDGRIKSGSWMGLGKGEGDRPVWR
jgi:hypothetical protein